MSNGFINLVWDYKADNSGQKLVLLALADHADKDGSCWPGVDKIVTKTGLKKRMVQNHLEALRVKEIITIDYNEGVKTPTGNTNLYTLSRGALQYTPSIEQGVQSSTNKGCSPVPQGVQPTAPKPKENPQFKPLVKDNGKTPASAGNKKPRKLSEYQLAIGELDNEFTRVTNIQPPPKGSKSYTYWFSGLSEIYKLSNKDAANGKKLICQAVVELKQSKMTIKTPNSLVKTITGLRQNENGTIDLAEKEYNGSYII